MVCIECMYDIVIYKYNFITGTKLLSFRSHTIKNWYNVLTFFNFKDRKVRKQLE